MRSLGVQWTKPIDLAITSTPAQALGDGNSQVCLFWRAFDWQMLRAKCIEASTHTHTCSLPAYAAVFCHITHRTCTSADRVLCCSLPPQRKWKSEYLHKIFFFVRVFFFQFSRSTRKRVSLTSWPGYSYRCQQNIFSKGYRVWNSLRIHIECESSEWSDKGKMHNDERQKVESTRAWGQEERKRWSDLRSFFL